MHLDCGFGTAEPCPGKQRQTEIDGGGIQGIQIFTQRHPQGIVSIQRTGDTDDSLITVGIGSQVSCLDSLASARVETPCHGIPCDRAYSAESEGRLRCRASSRDKSIGQRPSPETGPNKKSSLDRNCRGSELRTSETLCAADARSIARRRFGQDSWAIVASLQDAPKTLDFRPIEFKSFPA